MEKQKLFIRLKPVIIICLVIGCILLAVFAALYVRHAVCDSRGNSENASGIKKSSLLIDAGHGGEDGGAVSADGTVEKDINLAISLPLADMLRVCGYDIVMTRDGDYSIGDKSLKSVRERKVSDLQNRLKLFDQSHMVISIHENQFPQTQYYGTQIFYGIKCAESQPLASSVRETVLGMLQPDNTRQLKKATKDIYLLYNTTSPAIIVECGFLSNTGELAKLKNAEYQQQMAFAIGCGVLAFGQ